MLNVDCLRKGNANRCNFNRVPPMSAPCPLWGTRKGVGAIAPPSNAPANRSLPYLHGSLAIMLTFQYWLWWKKKTNGLKFKDASQPVLLVVILWLCVCLKIYRYTVRPIKLWNRKPKCNQSNTPISLFSEMGLCTALFYVYWTI